MFFLIKFIILALFLVVFFFIPLGSKPLYNHVKAIWSTPPAQELKRDFIQNLTQVETWMRAHEALSGETEPGHKQMIDDGTGGVPRTETMKEESNPAPPKSQVPQNTAAPPPTTEKPKTRPRKTKPSTERTSRRSGKTGGDIP